MLNRVANTIPQDHGPSFEPLSKNLDEVAVSQNSNESRICSHQVLVSSPPVEELTVENITRRIYRKIRKDMNQAKTAESHVLDIQNNEPQLPDLSAVAVAKYRNNDQTT